MLFRDRYEAGRLLATKLERFKGQKDVIVIGLARGGVVVAFEVAKFLQTPLNVVVPRKIGAPGNPEFALGSIMEDGEGVFNDSIIQIMKVSQHYLMSEIEKQKALAQQRLSLYRQYAPLLDVKNRTVILVDDGIATGSTMLASIKLMRRLQVSQIIVAVPVASTDAAHLMKKVADELVCLSIPKDFIGVGMFYEQFDQTEDKEVVSLIQKANHDAQ